MASGGASPGSGVRGTCACGAGWSGACIPAAPLLTSFGLHCTGGFGGGIYITLFTGPGWGGEAVG